MFQYLIIALEISLKTSIACQIWDISSYVMIHTDKKDVELEIDNSMKSDR